MVYVGSHREPKSSLRETLRGTCVASISAQTRRSTRVFGGEDKESIAKELRWLRNAGAAQTTVLVSHDIDRLDALVAQGRLKAGFDLAKP